MISDMNVVLYEISIAHVCVTFATLTKCGFKSVICHIYPIIYYILKGKMTFEAQRQMRHMHRTNETNVISQFLDIPK